MKWRMDQKIYTDKYKDRSHSYNTKLFLFEFISKIQSSPIKLVFVLYSFSLLFL